ncbi:hypothetical protein Anapl_14619 [Anas platyrhynchos]|uniref:Uncharacterized protein n=1 Tax=Anas platyrhynchos TaxID=8839 RepID=R0JIZ9_ANAPL|nr:hypothetical protein Anapl_14619 [Anas platyrhynchos]
MVPRKGAKFLTPQILRVGLTEKALEEKKDVDITALATAEQTEPAADAGEDDMCQCKPTKSLPTLKYSQPQAAPNTCLSRQAAAEKPQVRGEVMGHQPTRAQSTADLTLQGRDEQGRACCATIHPSIHRSRQAAAEKPQVRGEVMGHQPTRAQRNQEKKKKVTTAPGKTLFTDNSTLNGKIHQMLVEIRKKKSVQLFSELGKEPDFTEKCCHPRMTTGALQTENRKEQGRVHHPLSQAAPLPVRSLYAVSEGGWKYTRYLNDSTLRKEHRTENSCWLSHTTPTAQVHVVKQQDHSNSNAQTTNLREKPQETEGQLQGHPTANNLGTFKVQVKSDKLPHCNTKLPKTRKASHCMLHSGPFKTGTSPFITGIQRSKATTHCSQRLLSALQLPGYFRCKAYFKNCNLREIQRQFLESSLLRLKHRLKSYRTNTGRQITGYEEELSKVPDAVIDSSLDFVSRKAHGSTGKGLAAQALGAKGHTKGSMETQDFERKLLRSNQQAHEARRKQQLKQTELSKQPRSEGTKPKKSRAQTPQQL